MRRFDRERLMAAQQGRAHVGHDDLVGFQVRTELRHEPVGVHEAALVGVFRPDPREAGARGLTAGNPGGMCGGGGARRG